MATGVVTLPPGNPFSEGPRVRLHRQRRRCRDDRRRRLRAFTLRRWSARPQSLRYYIHYMHATADGVVYYIGVYICTYIYSLGQYLRVRLYLQVCSGVEVNANDISKI